MFSILVIVQIIPATISFYFELKTILQNKMGFGKYLAHSIIKGLTLNQYSNQLTKFYSMKLMNKILYCDPFSFKLRQGVSFETISFSEIDQKGRWNQPDINALETSVNKVKLMYVERKMKSIESILGSSDNYKRTDVIEVETILDSLDPNFFETISDFKKVIREEGNLLVKILNKENLIWDNKSISIRRSLKEFRSTVDRLKLISETCCKGIGIFMKVKDVELHNNNYKYMKELRIMCDKIKEKRRGKKKHQIEDYSDFEVRIEKIGFIMEINKMIGLLYANYQELQKKRSNLDKAIKKYYENRYYKMEFDGQMKYKKPENYSKSIWEIKSREGVINVFNFLSSSKKFFVSYKVGNKYLKRGIITHCKRDSLKFRKMLGEMEKRVGDDTYIIKEGSMKQIGETCYLHCQSYDQIMEVFENIGKYKMKREVYFKSYYAGGEKVIVSDERFETACKKISSSLWGENGLKFLSYVMTKLWCVKKPVEAPNKLWKHYLCDINEIYKLLYCEFNPKVKQEEYEKIKLIKKCQNVGTSKTFRRIVNSGELFKGKIRHEINNLDIREFNLDSCKDDHNICSKKDTTSGEDWRNTEGKRVVETRGKDREKGEKEPKEVENKIEFDENRLNINIENGFMVINLINVEGLAEEIEEAISILKTTKMRNLNDLIEERNREISDETFEEYNSLIKGMGEMDTIKLINTLDMEGILNEGKFFYEGEFYGIMEFGKIFGQGERRKEDKINKSKWNDLYKKLKKIRNKIKPKLNPLWKLTKNVDLGGKEIDKLIDKLNKIEVLKLEIETEAAEMSEKLGVRVTDGIKNKTGKEKIFNYMVETNLNFRSKWNGDHINGEGKEVSEFEAVNLYSVGSSISKESVFISEKSDIGGRIKFEFSQYIKKSRINIEGSLFTANVKILSKGNSGKEMKEDMPEETKEEFEVKEVIVNKQISNSVIIKVKDINESILNSTKVLNKINLTTEKIFKQKHVKSVFSEWKEDRKRNRKKGGGNKSKKENKGKDIEDTKRNSISLGSGEGICFKMFINDAIEGLNRNIRKSKKKSYLKIGSSINEDLSKDYINKKCSFLPISYIFSLGSKIRQESEEISFSGVKPTNKRFVEVINFEKMTEPIYSSTNLSRKKMKLIIKAIFRMIGLKIKSKEQVKFKLEREKKENEKERNKRKEEKEKSRSKNKNKNAMKMETLRGNVLSWGK